MRLRREPSVKLSMCAFVHAADARARVTMAERDEQPDEGLVLHVAHELHHERKGALRCGLVGDRQIELRAAGKRGAVAP
jgi:hypothetical protein